MADPMVLLRLSGSAPPDRLHAWVDALGRVTASRRVLELSAGPTPAELAGWADKAGVELRAPVTDVDVLVLARAPDLPTPGTLRRLVEASVDSAEALEARVLPCGAVATASDRSALSGPTVCVALPPSAPVDALGATSPAQAMAGLRAAGIDVRRHEPAAVFVAAWPESADSAPSPEEAPAYGHPALMPSTSLHQALTGAGLPLPDLPRDEEQRPLLSVLTRTQGTRLLCLEETLTCLAGQSSRDFEIVLACHRASADAHHAVADLLTTMPVWLQERTRVLRVDRPGRSSPLNDALDVARGRYAVMLDDDDVVTSGWVAAFAEAEVRGPGTVLRSVALAQDVLPLVVDPVEGPAPAEVGAARSVWSTEFSLVRHLMDNDSPPMTFAVPRGVFDDLGQRFDEGLDTTEDWDFLLRAAIVAGTTSTSAVTAVYRVWVDGEGSRHLHPEDQWAAGRARVLSSIDRQVVLLPPGAAKDIRDLHQALLDEQAEKFRFARLNEQAARDLVSVNEAVAALRSRIADLEERLARQRRRRAQES